MGTRELIIQMGCCLVLLGVVGAVLLSIVVTHYQQAGEKRLRQRAQADFVAARGTAHLRLLDAAYKRLLKQSEAADERIKQKQEELNRVRREGRTALRQAVVRQLVEAELADLPGIGPRLAPAILSGVFRGELDDLRHAYTLEGIGAQRQAALNAWVDAQRPRLPELIAGEFPGKIAILQQYEPAIEQQAAELAAEEDEQLERWSLLEQIEAERKRLNQVNAAGFDTCPSTTCRSSTCAIWPRCARRWPPC